MNKFRQFPVYILFDYCNRLDAKGLESWIRKLKLCLGCVNAGSPWTKPISSSYTVARLIVVLLMVEEGSAAVIAVFFRTDIRF